MADDLTLSIKTTAEMTSTELWEVFQERVKVFVVEQNCPYQEVDEKDQNARHVMIKETVGWWHMLELFRMTIQIILVLAECLWLKSFGGSI